MECTSANGINRGVQLFQTIPGRPDCRGGLVETATAEVVIGHTCQRLSRKDKKGPVSCSEMQAALLSPLRSPGHARVLLTECLANLILSAD